MQGVVIWYSKADFQAIIWCEDSKDLGIASGPTAWRNPMATVEIGDAVAFRIGGPGDARRCTDVHLIASSVAPALPDSIRTPLPSPHFRTRNRLLHLCASRD